jgi:RNA polymerase sigma-70 factor (ECF subfamily)
MTIEGALLEVIAEGIASPDVDRQSGAAAGSLAEGSEAQPGDADPSSDAGLVRQVLAGSQDAFASLYDRHSDAVFAAAVRTSRDRGIAAELVQETFLALWNRAELYDPARGALSSWLLTIARNRAVDHLRVAMRRDRATSFSALGRDGVTDDSLVEWLTGAGDLVGSAGPEVLPDEALTRKETRAAIDRAISSLAPSERSVILLAYDGGLTQAEIADRLGWPLGTVKTRTRRALSRMREILEKADGGGSDGTGAGRAGARRAGGELTGGDRRGASRSASAAWQPLNGAGPTPCPSPCN